MSKEEADNLNSLNNCQRFSDLLEEVEDNVLFTPVSSNDECFSLNDVLNHAFILFYYHMLDTLSILNSDDMIERVQLAFLQEAQLSFSKFLRYTINARRVLTSMNYSKEDCALEIKNNPVFDFKNFIEVIDEKSEDYRTCLTTDVLHNKYMARAFEVIPLLQGFAFKVVNFNDINWNAFDSLNSREKEAFYGKEAQEVMGWIPTDIINKGKLYQKIIK